MPVRHSEGAALQAALSHVLDELTVIQGHAKTLGDDGIVILDIADSTILFLDEVLKDGLTNERTREKRYANIRRSAEVLSARARRGGEVQQGGQRPAQSGLASTVDKKQVR